MSFLKITDPKKRDIIVAEYLKTKRNIQNQQLTERLGDQNALVELTKQYKPITDVQKDIAQSVLSEIKPIKESIQDLPKALPFPHIPAIEGLVGSHTRLEDDENEDEDNPEMIGNVAAQYLRKFASRDADKTYGIYDKSGQFYIGDTRVGVIDDNIIVGDKEYQGTPGLWELIVMRMPSEELYTTTDLQNYAEIMVRTNSLRKGNSKESKAPKASKGWKWKYLLKTIWDERKQFEGEGIGGLAHARLGDTIILPSDPNALLDRLDLLSASKAAGNTGVQNELVSICDELKRQKIIDANYYKNLMSTI